MSECGTYSAYQAHKRAGEDADPACRRAAADYLAAWRTDHPVGRAEERRRNRARSKALRRLGRMHSDELQALILEELANERPSLYRQEART